MTLTSTKENYQMSKSDSGRIQSSQAKGGGDISSGGFASRAQSAGDRNQATQTSSHAGRSGGQQAAGSKGSSGSSYTNTDAGRKK